MATLLGAGTESKPNYPKCDRLMCDQPALLKCDLCPRRCCPEHVGDYGEYKQACSMCTWIGLDGAELQPATLREQVQDAIEDVLLIMGNNADDDQVNQLDKVLTHLLEGRTIQCQYEQERQLRAIGSTSTLQK